MKTSEIEETHVYESFVIDTIEEMIKIAKEDNVTARQEINGVMVLVNGDSSIDRIFRDQQRAQSDYIEGDVGPYPKADLSAKEMARDARIEAKYERERREKHAKYEKERRAKREAVKAKLAGKPELEYADEVARVIWRKTKRVNRSFYGRGVVAFAARWARLMQLEIIDGKRLEDVANVTSREADTDDITGFMYGCAVALLAKCWKYGDQLRRWNNIKCQIHDEGEKANESGGVLNPALLSVSIG